MKTILTATVILLLGVTSAFAQVAMPRKDDTKMPEPWKSAKPATRLSAIRAAEADAKRRLVERVYGHQVDGRSLVYNFVLESDVVKNKVGRLLRGATATKRPEYTEDGIVYVVYGVKIRSVLEIVKSEFKKRNGKTIAAEIERRIQTEDRLIEALGTSALPGTKGMKLIQAKRAAEVDAFRRMAERIAGVKITASTTVRKLMLEDDTIMTEVAAYLKGLKPIDIVYHDDNTCEVKLQLKVRQVIETLERTVTRRQSTFRTSVEEIIKLNTEVKDKYFTVTGRGAAKEALPRKHGGGRTAAGMYSVEKTIIRKVIRENVVVD